MEEKDIETFKKLIKSMKKRLDNYELNGLSQPEIQYTRLKSGDYSYIITLERIKN